MERGTERDLVGRDKEVEDLCDLVDGVAASHAGRVIIVEGEGGIGKTRLLEEVLAYAKLREFKVLEAACEELERTLPFAAIGRALGATRNAPDARLAAIAELLSGPPSEESVPLLPGHAEMRFLVLEEMIAFVEQAASVSPQAIAIEDIHWADPSSLLAVRALGRRVAPLPVVLIVTLRPTPQSPELAGVLASFLAEHAVRLRLDPLGDEAVESLLTMIVGAAPGERLHKRAGGAGGNPFYLIELTTALLDEDLVEIADGCADIRDEYLPTSLRDTILRRLNFLSQLAMQTLQMASILGSSFDVIDLCMCLGSSTVELLPTLQEVVGAGVVQGDDERLAFRHDLLHMVIYDALPPAVRRGMHRDAGRVLAAAGRPPDQVAPHMAAGASTGDAEAIEWLLRAARGIASRSPSSAVEFLLRAMDLVDPSDPLRDELTAELVAALVWSGRSVDAERAAREALSRTVTSQSAGNLRWALAEAVAVQGRLGEALEHIEAAVREPGIPEWRRPRLMAAASQWRFYTADLEGSEAVAERAVAEGECHGDDVAVSLGLSTLSRVAMERCDFARAISLGRQSSRRVGESGMDKKETDWIHPSFDLAGALVVADQLAEAKEVLRAGRRLREELGSTWDLPLFTNTLAYTYLYSGEWDDAIAEAQTVVSLMEEGGARGSALWAYSLLAYIALHRDGVEAAEEVLEIAEQVIKVAGPGMGGDQVLWCEALVKEARGDLEHAWSLIERAWDLELPFKVVTRSRMGPDAVRLASSNGRHRQARSIVEDVEVLANKAGVALYTGVALRCRGLLEASADGLLQSVSALRNSSRPVELAFACEDAGISLGRAGRIPESSSLLEEAIGIYERVGAARDIARCEGALRASGVRRGRRGKRSRDSMGWSSLTRTEKDVVDLVAEGLTNREVGARLFISRRTVETHLSHVFRKLGLSSRVELAAESARRAPVRRFMS